MSSKARVSEAEGDPVADGSELAGDLDEGGEGLRFLPGRFRLRPVEEPEEVDPLSSIGYSAGSQAAPELSGVLEYASALAQPGLNFMVSGHMPGAVLMDMEGTVLHEWRAGFMDIWPEREWELDQVDTRFWRRAFLLDNGDVIGIMESVGIFQLDRDSNVLWAHRIGVHHDLQVMESGEIIALGRHLNLRPKAVETLHALSALRPPELQDTKHMILEDFVLRFTPDHKVDRSLSLYRCFANADPEHFWVEPAKRFWKNEGSRELTGSHRDLFHTNSLEVLDGRIAERVPEFAAGNFLVSMRHLDMIAVIDPNVQKVVWSMTGASSLQHDAQITPEGNLLYFDNQWKPGRSRLAAVDPLTREVVWEYGTRPGEEFYSETCGTVQVLPNTNLLVSVTDSGRAFEITHDGKLVWEFYNPNGVGDDNEFIASLFDVVRVDSDVVASWLQ